MKRILVVIMLILTTWLGLTAAPAPSEEPVVVHTMSCSGTQAEDPLWCMQ